MTPSPVERIPIIARLLESDEPVIRYLTLANVLGLPPGSPRVRRERKQIPGSQLVRTLLSEVGRKGTIPLSPYRKWRGAHWVLVMLSEIGYPPGDEGLRPLFDQAVNWALEMEPKVIDGRARRCASQQGYCLLYQLRLGFHDERADELAKRLVQWQWPDGGWNCDKRPVAHHSSFDESLIPMRALFAYAEHTGDRKARSAAMRTAEMLLERKLFRRKTTGEVIRSRYADIHYPYAWQYTFLHALKAMAEAGLLGDPRCREALELLESKRLDGGGFPCERTNYALRDGQRCPKAESLVRWGPSGRRQTNEFVTAEALHVLRAAGRS